jgi:hypothetical protein
MIGRDTPLLMSKAAALFTIDLTSQAAACAAARRSDSLDVVDIAAAIAARPDQFDFLEDVVPAPGVRKWSDAGAPGSAHPPPAAAAAAASAAAAAAASASASSGSGGARRGRKRGAGDRSS